ncbi:hypothetical protein C2G38_2027068 [Gigaspora rosea]|uniref:ZSWIM1/3 RNaseH-like domain-containing protein n=1 Tax=Gigaspora rosea TaxID=44941 RepID=A0A397W950_9GLOM|nr:hypothetical protein C2G38_2027068 [Gigaspora rosea]
MAWIGTESYKKWDANGIKYGTTPFLLCERDVKTITLIDEHANQLSHATFAYVEYLECSARNGCRKGECNWKGHISVPKDKPLNLCNIECHRNHDPEHVRKKTLRISNSVRKTIANRVANVTPSMLATELMNNSKILDTTSNTPLNHVQLTSTRFAPNLESIQNALKYDKKLHHPSVSELEKVCSLMDDYKAEGTVILKQYGIKDTQDPKKQAVLLGIASTIMPALLTKYPDFLAIDSTGCHNSLNFPNTAFMVRSDEPRGRVVATFVNDKETIPVIDRMFELFIQYSIDNGVQLNPKWLAMDKWDPYLAAAKKHFPNTQVILCDWHEGFGEEKANLLQHRNFKEKKKVNIMGENLYKQNLVQGLQMNQLQAALSSLIFTKKDANGHNKDKLRLPEKRSSKNKRKNRLVPGESIKFRDTILDMPCQMVRLSWILPLKMVIKINT